jgi:hypothetical protein
MLIGLLLVLLSKRAARNAEDISGAPGEILLARFAG